MIYCVLTFCQLENDMTLREIQFKKAKIKAKKKPRRRSDSSGGYTLSDIIQSPPAAGTHQHIKGLFEAYLSCRHSSVDTILKNDMVGIKLFSFISDLSIHGEVREGEL